MRKVTDLYGVLLLDVEKDEVEFITESIDSHIRWVKKYSKKDIPNFCTFIFKKYHKTTKYKEVAEILYKLVAD